MRRQAGSAILGISNRMEVDDMKLAVIDGQGGRIGAQLVAAIRQAGLPGEVLAIGTNSAATAAMMKAGADAGATGENPVIVACRDADVIIVVKDGKILRASKVRVIRDGIVIYTGELGSLKRFKDDVTEVLTGMDCGLNIASFNDIKVGDFIESYQIEEENA